jgi:hypothetical protein
MLDTPLQKIVSAKVPGKTTTVQSDDKKIKDTNRITTPVSGEGNTIKVENQETKPLSVASYQKLVQLLQGIDTTVTRGL